MRSHGPTARGSVGRTTDADVRVVAVNSREPAGDWGRRTVPVERRTRLGDPRGAMSSSASGRRTVEPGIEDSDAKRDLLNGRLT